MLERLGLSQYRQAFAEEGFDTWDTLMDITESDMELLGVKLGHRRKLQRAIFDARGRNKDYVPLDIRQRSQPREENDRGDEEAARSAKEQKRLSGTQGNNPGTKRKYKRHPKPDEFAPDRPPSAYVIFSNQMRDRLKGQDLSFTDIAKIVGERWQDLSTVQKEPCERRAQNLKEKYYADLAEYKKTPQYTQYQEYLVAFKAKHNQQPAQASDSKRPRMESDNQNIIRTDGLDIGRKQISTQIKGSRVRLSESPVSPSYASQASENDYSDSFPVAQHTRYPFHSPNSGDKSPPAASPRTSNFRPFPLGPSLDDDTRSTDTAKRQVLPLHFLPSQSSGSLTNADLSAVPQYLPSPPGSNLHSYNLKDSAMSPNRRLARNSDSLTSLTPSLTREDTGTSNVSERSPYGNGSSWSNQPMYGLPSLDVSNGSRTLPPPISLVSSISARPLASTASSRQTSQNRGQSYDTRAKSSIATLLRAGEQLDRDMQRRSGLGTC